MKKYNCNNTLDYAHELTRMCNTFRCSSDCPLYVLPCGAAKNITPEHIRRVQAWSDAHPEITLTDKQVEIFKALNLLGFRYIAKDANGNAYAYTYCPEKGDRAWLYININEEIIKIQKLRTDATTALVQLVSWEDEKPLNIAEALEQAEVHP